MLSLYLNFHSPYLFPSETLDAQGRRRKHYRDQDQDLMTPYDKLKSLPEATHYLKPDVSFEQLDAIAHAMSDNETARRFKQARAKLFHSINKAQASAA